MVRRWRRRRKVGGKAEASSHVDVSTCEVWGCAEDVTDGSQYFVLLMITDGVISDMAAALPMSIIIVGVGPAEFDAMEELDGDEVRVSSKGRNAERDIVQFVPFRDYIDRQGNQVLSMARLAKDVLAEIPEQLLGFMKTRDIEPRSASSTTTTTPLGLHNLHI
ncbi:unnamed protein product [Coregonus sp. 'balchen']|nr:unnamed protein product [Coregonus sp. 'balchen']